MREKEHLIVGNHRYDLFQILNIYMIGVGKASAPMAAAIWEMLGDRIEQAPKSGDQTFKQTVRHHQHSWWPPEVPSKGADNRSGFDLPLCDAPSIAEAGEKELWLFER